LYGILFARLFCQVDVSYFAIVPSSLCQKTKSTFILPLCQSILLSHELHIAKSSSSHCWIAIATLPMLKVHSFSAETSASERKPPNFQAA
jgi:hypothetical protein